MWKGICILACLSAAATTSAYPALTNDKLIADPPSQTGPSAAAAAADEEDASQTTPPAPLVATSTDRATTRAATSGLHPGPRNLSAITAGPTYIQLEWLFDPPLSSSGGSSGGSNVTIKGYRIIYMHQKFKNVKTIKSSSRKYNLTGLNPFTKYTIWIKALLVDSTNDEEFLSDKSEAILVETDVGEPSAPIITNLTCYESNSLFIQWKRPGMRRSKDK